MTRIDEGKPDQHAYLERFHRSYRTEILDAYLFESLAEVRALTDRWLTSYNHERPHDNLGRVPPLSSHTNSATPPNTFWRYHTSSEDME
jgi:putative transposase